MHIGRRAYDVSWHIYIKIPGLYEHIRTEQTHVIYHTGNEAGGVMCHVDINDLHQCHGRQVMDLDLIHRHEGGYIGWAGHYHTGAATPCDLH